MVRLKFTKWAIIGGTLLSWGVSFNALAESLSNVIAVLELGMGARPLSMGGACVGLADDANALFFNPAGLGKLKTLTVLSSVEIRPDIAVFGHFSVVAPNLGLGVHYFDFGEVPQVDEYGNVVGNFSYRNYIVIVGTGICGQNFQILNRIPLLRDLALGIKLKYCKIITLDAGSGDGLALDLSALYRGMGSGLGAGVLTGLGFGIIMENVLGIPIRYGSGHEELWPSIVVIGFSLTFVETLTVLLDVVPRNGIRVGAEWCPVPTVAIRAGLRNEGLPLVSLGLGVQYGIFALDYAYVTHPYLAGQHRFSLEVSVRW